MISQKIKNWLKKEKKQHLIKVNITKLSSLKNWDFTNKAISHKSGRFFKIVGLKIYTNFFKKNWDQPIIIQNEIGILGIIKNKITKKYLLQAKVEPGNKNKLQLSPTVQATKSNYSQVHGGKKVPYLKFFLKLDKKNIEDQSEQGFRYLNKFNSNIIITVKKKINLLPGFFWFSIEDLNHLIKKKNILNMDTISVFSSFIKKSTIDKPLNSTKKIKGIIFKNDKKFFMKKKIIPLVSLKDWKLSFNEITHKYKKHFSIIGAKIKTNKREIHEWHQPLIKGKKLALAGFLIKEINNTNHYLCRYTMKPGLNKSVISCTVNTSEINTYINNNNLTTFQKKIINEYFFNQDKVKNKLLYDNIISDEGGRFYHCEIRNIVILLNENINIKLPTTYFWVSQNQMIGMIKDKRVDIETRLLFGCINIKNLI